MTDKIQDSDEQAFILALDYRKAFDSICWSTLFKALELFNFGENFRDSISMLFNGIETCTSNAGFTSEYFKPTNGVRQGCCASPLLFVITVELMAIMVRNNNDIRGVQIGEYQHKISQFADDTTCYLGDASSLAAAVNTLEIFSRFSGLHINLDKSSIIPLGRAPPIPPPDLGIEVARKVKILGIWHANNRSAQDHYEWNFRPVLDKMRTCCSSWSNRSLSLKGRTTVFNSLVFSLLQYVNSTTYTPSRVIPEVRQLAGNFLWGGKQNKVAHKTIIQSAEDGGLKIMDMLARTQTNHLSWIKRIIKNPTGTTAETVRHILKGLDVKLQLATKQNPPPDADRTSPFYAEVLKTWAQVHVFSPRNEEEVQGEVIWNNLFTSSPRQTLSTQRWNRWVSAGIIVVNDICHPSENRLLGQEEIANKFGIRVNFLDALSIRNSVPHSWRSMLSDNFTQSVELKFKMLINQKSFEVTQSSPKGWYTELIKTQQIPIKRQDSWAREMEIEEGDPPPQLARHLHYAL